VNISANLSNLIKALLIVALPAGCPETHRHEDHTWYCCPSNPKSYPVRCDVPVEGLEAAHR